MKGITRRELLRLGALTGAGLLVSGRASAAPLMAKLRADPVTLEFWNTFSEAEIALLHQFGDEYMKLNPDIKINFYEIPYDQRPTKVPTAVETDTLPDILRADYPYQWYLAKLDKLAYLEDSLKDWPMMDLIYDVIWEDLTYEGHIIGVPQDKFTSVFCYNKDKFERDGVERFPETWDELVEACKKMTHDDEYGVAFQTTQWEFFPLVYQAGGEPFDKELNPTFNSEAGVTALQFLYDLVNKHKVTPPGVAGWGYAENDDALKGEKIGMTVFGSWIIGNYKAAGVPWKLGIGAWPEGPGGRGTLAGTCMYMVMNTSPHVKEAVELLKWIVSEKNTFRWAKELNHEPIDTGTAADPYFQDPLFEPFKKSLEFAHSMAPLPEWNAIADALHKAIQKALLNEATPKEALDEAAGLAEKVIRKPSS